MGPPRAERAAGREEDVVARFARARRDPALVRLEGVHALKHAVRFGAEVEVVATADPVALRSLLAELAPDVRLPTAPVPLSSPAWAAVISRELPSPVVALARRPRVGPEDVLAAPGRLVVLERPRHFGNLGAVVRVAAAARAGGVLVLGDADPWHPTAVRGAAGLQFAIPVAVTDTLPATSRPVVALDADGTAITGTRIPDDALLLFGTERGGLSIEAKARAETTVAIPMRPGVSSLNLATAVAVALYT